MLEQKNRPINFKVFKILIRKWNILEAKFSINSKIKYSLNQYEWN